MPRLSTARAALIAAGVAALVYANAYRNDWALDDMGAVRNNPAAHSIEAAWEARFSTYWHAIGQDTAGLYRPAVVMSYALDWTIAGDRPWWFHIINVLLHALVTGLVVVVAAAWLPPVGGLVAGLVFAVHPLHVEAVANVVGRAEILAAAGLLLAVLAFRRYRESDSERGRVGWFAATLAAVLLALLSKEHGAVAVAILALDAFLARERARRPRPRPVGGLLIAVLALTMAWFVVWHAVAAQYVGSSAATSLRYLSLGERLATMLPVYLEVMRLLTWPLQLAHDYNPQLIPQRTEFGAIAALGLATVSAVLALAALCLRRAPAVSFGVLLGLLTYAPTANVLFASGTLLGERTLYLAAGAPALAAGWLVVHYERRRIALIVVSAFLLVYSVRTFTRTPFWLTSSNVTLEGWLQYPENFRTHLELGRLYLFAGDSTRALSEFLVGGALFDRNPFVVELSAPIALALGRERMALVETERAWALRPGHPEITSLHVAALGANGLHDSARAVAREGIEAAPHHRTPAFIYRQLLGAEAPAWQITLAEARLDWLELDLARTTEKLKAVESLLGPDVKLEGFCWEFGNLWPVIQALHRPLGEVALTVANTERLDCAFQGTLAAAPAAKAADSPVMADGPLLSRY